MKEFSNKFNIKIADTVIQIDTVSFRTSVLCWDYICEDEPEVYVKVTDEDVQYEAREGESIGKKPGTVLYDTVAAYRKIVEKLIPRDIFLMHGAVVAVGNNAYMFSAPSHTGKTTHILKWLKNIKNAYVVNGDKPLIKMTEKEVIACGTPWAGNEQLNTNTMVPLKAIVLMERSNHNTMRELAFTEAFPQLLRQTYVPHDLELAKKVYSLLAQLNGKIKVYKFSFNNFAEDCFQVAYDTLTED